MRHLRRRLRSLLGAGGEADRAERGDEGALHEGLSSLEVREYDRGNGLWFRGIVSRPTVDRPAAGPGVGDRREARSPYHVARGPLDLRPDRCAGAEGVGASIVMTPESITFKVGETAMVMTAEGIVTECGGTLIEVSAEGINEEVGDITREMNVEGHTFTAAETVFSVGTGGLDFEAVTFNGEIESSQEVNASVNNSTYQTVESEASMTTIQ